MPEDKTFRGTLPVTQGSSIEQSMKRRTFIKSMGSGALLALGPRFAEGAETVSDEAIRVLFKAGRPLGHFPNATGPRILATDGRGLFALLNSDTDTLLQNGEQTRVWFDRRGNLQ